MPDTTHASLSRPHPHPKPSSSSSSHLLVPLQLARPWLCSAVQRGNATACCSCPHYAHSAPTLPASLPTRVSHLLRRGTASAPAAKPADASGKQGASSKVADSPKVAVAKPKAESMLKVVS